MPLYEFICAGCQEQFETLIRKQADQATLSCPKCHSRKVEQQFSVFGMISHSKSDGATASSDASCTSCSSHSCASCHN